MKTLSHSYSRSEHSEEVMELLRLAYDDVPDRLAAFNSRLIKSIVDYLGLDTQMVWSSNLDVEGTSDERLINLVRAAGGSTYLSGAGGQNYQDPARFAAAGIELDVRSYMPKPYQAPRFEFIPALSIIDALFIKGVEAAALLTYD